MIHSFIIKEISNHYKFLGLIYYIALDLTILNWPTTVLFFIQIVNTNKLGISHVDGDLEFV